MNDRHFVKPDYISHEDFQVMKDVVRRLADAYPPDWLERDGPMLYKATLAISFLTAALIGLAWGPWWGFTIPLIAPTLLLIVLPRLLFGREVGNPRWAHPQAVLDRHDCIRVDRIVKTLQRISSLDLADIHAVDSGDQFYAVWQRIGCCPGRRMV